MGIFDKAKGLVSGQAGDNYLSRTRSGIALTSPSGKEFTGDFVSSESSQEKKLQITSYFGIKKSKVKDLEIGSSTHNIPFSFSGPDNDLVANDFWNTCDESGQWEIIHPVIGRLSLQLVSVTRKDDPVNNGNQTDFDSNWIEPENEEAPFSGRQLASMAEFSIAEYNDSSALSFADKLNVLSESLRNNVSNVVGLVAGVSDKILGPVAALSDFAYESFHTVMDGINQIERLTIIEALALAGQIQNLIQLALTSTSDPQKRSRKYLELSENISKITNDDSGNAIKITNDDFGKNTAAIIELTRNTIVASVCKIAITSTITTKNEARKLISDLIDVIDYTDTELDKIQTVFNEEDITIDRSFIHGFDRKERDVAVSNTIKYIITVAIQQKPEKIKTIDRFIPTIVFCANEYHSIDDNLFQKFIDKNDISGDNILILNPGQEVII
jgi:hypothetical protein